MREIVICQVVIERMVEAALVTDGIAPHDILDNRDQFRNCLFYPHGRSFSEKTYLKYIQSMDNHGTRNSIPYIRVRKAIRDSALIFRPRR